MNGASSLKLRRFESWMLPGRKGLVLRLLGSLAFRLHCPEYGYLQKQLGRAYTDIDYAGYGGQASKMTPMLSNWVITRMRK